MRPAADFDLDAWCAPAMEALERALQRALQPNVGEASHSAPLALLEAMRYAVLDGGKRLRPLLVIAAHQAAASGLQPSAPDAEDFDEAIRRGSNSRWLALADDMDAADAPDLPDAVLRAACAVELIHAYSLVHDDMPCMDNDVLRRGKPTVHVRFGQAQALLAGDALQALAFEVLTPDTADLSVFDLARQARLCRTLARAAGACGMAGGQAIDLASVGQSLSPDQLRTMHRMKTGALLQASVRMGALCADPGRAALAALDDYGAAIGLAFQVVDDILDVTADTQTLGKTAGKDALHDKPTYVSSLGLDGAQAMAQQLLDQALDALASSQLNDTRALAALAHRLICRSH
ncbi:MAG: (2E,6E)-farnesyl diphosphate synthase [Rhodoferax sp.]